MDKQLELHDITVRPLTPEGYGEPIHLADATALFRSKGYPLWPCHFCGFFGPFERCAVGHSPAVPWTKDCGSCHHVPRPF